MKQYLVKKSSIKGEIAIPPSKSQTLRAILFASMANGKSIIHSALPSPDAKAMVEACRTLGATVDYYYDHIAVDGLNGQIDSAEDVIHAGNSGIVLRFIAAIASLGKHPIVITGDHSIRHQRPMKPLLSALTQLGVKAISTKDDGFAPIIIQGPLTSGTASVLGEDSQHVSALLIAAAFAKGPIEIFVENPGEKPWIDLTLHWFNLLGIPYENHGYTRYRIPGDSRFAGFQYTVPGDLSSASFPIAAALITDSDLTLRNVNLNDPQGDKKLIEVLQQMGAKIDIDAKQKTLHIHSGSKLQGTTVDINDFVDAIAILAVIGCYAEGETKIINAGVAKQKECDRIRCIALELTKMGASIEENPDGLTVRKSTLYGADLFSYHDHRMVMSLAVAGLGARGETIINDVECVSKTYPTFLNDFQSLGAEIFLL